MKTAETTMRILRPGSAKDTPYTEEVRIINGIEVLVKVYKHPADKLNKINEAKGATNANN